MFEMDYKSLEEECADGVGVHKDSSGEESFQSTLSRQTSSISQITDSCSISIQRRILRTQDVNPALHKLTCTKDQPDCYALHHQRPPPPISTQIKQEFSRQSRKFRDSCTPCIVITTLLPILGWLPRYNLRQDLLPDFVSGLTVFALRIPQSLAYGLLAGVDTINGLYVTLFPVLIYALFASSRHLSIGTFAVISIACKDVLNSLVAQGIVVLKADNDDLLLPTNGTTPTATPIEALTSLCLLVGVIQFGLGFLRLGILATLLSDPIISSFVSGCSIHVFTSQIFALFGVSSKPQKGEPQIPFELVQNWIRLFIQITRINWPTVIISVAAISTLVGCKSYLEPYLAKRFKLKNVTIPIDILTIITITALSYFFSFNSRFQVPIIPKIPSGFTNMPQSPRLDLWPYFLSQAILIAFICYTTGWTLAKMYAGKHGYEVYPNQELMAMGVANIFSAYFLCFPSSGALARSAVQEKTGGRTQISSLISAVPIFVFILFLSHYLETLPTCVLACIIVVALRSTLRKFTELFRYWRQSRIDGAVWIATFACVLLFGVGNGLLYGLLIGLALLIIRLAIPSFNLKYHLPDTEIYLPVQDIQSEPPRILIFEFHGPLIFLNVDRLKTKFEQHILEPLTQRMDSKDDSTAKSIIFDMSRVAYVDSKAVECLLELQAQLGRYQHVLLLANISHHLMDTFIACRLFDKLSPDKSFASVHDAFIAATKPAHSGPISP